MLPLIRLLISLHPSIHLFTCFWVLVFYPVGKANFGENEWYFFSPRDRKYPNGARPNRAATSGYWKATGTDKPILLSGGVQKVGVKKALVFYGGKPPRGMKTDWIMHEYRLINRSSSSKMPHPLVDHSKKGSLRVWLYFSFTILDFEVAGNAGN